MTCAIPDAPTWSAWHAFFVQVEAEKLPAAQTQSAFGQEGGCVAEAAWGGTEATKNVVTLKLQALTPGKTPPSPVMTTLARREAGLLAARLLLAKAEAERRAIVVVEVAPTEAETALVPSALRIEADGSDAAEESARILYGLRGWAADGDPGFRADVDALRALRTSGHRPSDVVARALTERRLRPGLLGDLALGWGFASAQ